MDVSTVIGAVAAGLFGYFVVRPAIRLFELRQKIITTYIRAMRTPVPQTPEIAVEVFKQRPDLPALIAAVKSELGDLAIELSAFNRAEPVVRLLGFLGVKRFENARSGLSGLAAWFADVPTRQLYDRQLKKALWFN